VIHEVVVRNRLEHLRKRQRDEALQAQQQLLADVIPEKSEYSQITEEKLEIPYLKNMSPRLISVNKLSHDDEELEILSENTEKEKLVSKPSLFTHLLILFPGRAQEKGYGIKVHR